MKLVNVKQGSIEWLLARAGLITASRIAEMMKYINKGKDESADRYNYRIELVTERLTGLPVDTFVSREMQWGTDNEPYARASYEIDRDVMTEQVGFVIHPDMDFAGASPDSLVDDRGIIEIKCPNTTTHIKWMQAGIVPEQHQDQCLFNMACTEREYCDFISYDPRLPAHLKSFIVRMQRDDERIAKIEAEVRKFNQEIIDLINSLPAAA